jgi:hypothetical protein
LASLVGLANLPMELYDELKRNLADETLCAMATIAHQAIWATRN